MGCYTALWLYRERNNMLGLPCPDAKSEGPDHIGVNLGAALSLYEYRHLMGLSWKKTRKFIFMKLLPILQEHVDSDRVCTQLNNTGNFAL